MQKTSISEKKKKKKVKKSTFEYDEATGLVSNLLLSVNVD